MRSSLPRLLLIAFVVFGAQAAHAQTVAVMPFRDLSGSESSVGEAIRESVTSDLKAVARLRVVERSEIDRVLGELKLRGSKLDEDGSAAVKVGKLLGATWMAVGAYQRAGDRIRLTARFVKVETGEIVGTAKVDGPQTQFLSLQDRVTTELLRSVKLAPVAAQRLARRSRPPLRNLKPVELYGRATVEKNEVKRTAYLREAVSEAPEYSYAADELAELEMRLRGYSAAARAEVERELERLRKEFEASEDPALREGLRRQLAGRLLQERRLRTLVALEQGRVRQLEGTTDPAELQLLEESQVRLILALGMLQLRDRLLREGERFLARYPASPHFQHVMSQVQNELAFRRRVVEHKEKAAQRLADVKGELRWDLCHLGRIYRSEYQLEEARRLFQACLKVGAEDPGATLAELIQLHLELGEFDHARADLERLKTEAPEEFAKQAPRFEQRMPTDG